MNPTLAWASVRRPCAEAGEVAARIRMRRRPPGQVISKQVIKAVKHQRLAHQKYRRIAAALAVRPSKSGPPPAGGLIAMPPHRTISHRPARNSSTEPARIAMV